MEANDRYIKGESVSAKGISEPYMIKIPPEKVKEKWQTRVVMSALPSDRLPTNIGQDGVKRICTVESALCENVVDQKLKNRHWYNRGEKFIRLKFNIKVILGAADLRFQMLSRAGQILSGEHDPIQVKWETPSKAKCGDEDGLATVYRAS